MKKTILSIVALTSLLMANEYKYEITPLGAYVDTKEHVDIKNHKVGGIAIGFIGDKDSIFTQTELSLLRTLGNADYENSTEDTSITRVFVNGIKEYKINDKFDLYAIAGFGIERISNELNKNNSDTFFNYGIGAKYKIYEDISLKIGARHLVKFDGDKDVIYTVGLAIPFGKKASKIIKQEPVKEVKTKDIIVEEPMKKEVVVPKEEIKIMKPIVVDKLQDLNILFAFDSDKIVNDYSIQLDKYAKYLNINKDTKIVLEGHTDSTGSHDYNLDLSNRRATSAKAYLVSKGVEGHRIETIGYGETKPKVNNKTAENRQINRRVTATVIK